MKNTVRLLIVIFLFLSGAALTPVLAANVVTDVRWERFSSAYRVADLSSNFQTGAPGSYFKFQGTGLPSNTDFEVFIGEEFAGEVRSDGLGNLVFVINTTDAQPGGYDVWINPEMGTPVVEIWIDPQAPLRPLTSDGPQLFLPIEAPSPDLFLPMIQL